MRFDSSASEGTYEDGVGAALVAALWQPQGLPLRRREATSVNSHLSEDQIAEWALGASDEYVLRHLETCAACFREAEELRSALTGFREAVHTTARRDPSFWRNQQLAVRERLSTKDWYPLHWGWVVAMVAVLITAILLARTPNAPKNFPSEDADNALLQAVQGDLNRDVPQALAPAVLIAEERSEILSKRRLTR